jgi:hypothetical protein
LNINEIAYTACERLFTPSDALFCVFTQYEKMTAHDKAEKQMAHERKEAREDEAKRVEHEKRAENAEAKHGHGHGHGELQQQLYGAGVGAAGGHEGMVSHPMTPGTTTFHSSNPPASQPNYVNTPHPMSTSTDPNYPPMS